MLYVICKGVAEDKNILNIDSDLVTKFLIEAILHKSDKHGWSLQVTLNHNSACKLAQWDLYGLIFDLISVLSGLKIGIAEIYLPLEFSSYYWIHDGLLSGDLGLISFLIHISESKIY